jgi:hypothetical protein
MGLKEVLSKLKLVEVSEPAAAGVDSPVAPPSGRAATGGATDSPELAELLRSLPPPKPIDDAALAKRRRAGAPTPAGPAGPAGEAAAAAEISDDDLELPDFPAVYSAAGIGEPPHGFTAFKILEMLQSPGLAELPPQAKASALAGFLRDESRRSRWRSARSSRTPCAATRRSTASSSSCRRSSPKRQAAAERANALLQAEIDALGRAPSRHHGRQHARHLRARRAGSPSGAPRKRAEERRLQSAVAPFVDGNPISTESADGESRGS